MATQSEPARAQLTSPHVSILCATYNGALYLRQQLDSIAAQTHHNWSLLVSDDKSSDDSRKIITEFREEGHDVALFDGPCSGGTANFMSLIARLPDNTDWVAFCDQDDVWLDNKLERGIAALANIPPDQPALYCSRTWVTDVALEGRKISAPRPRPASFRNALIQNIASGNTILLNPAAARLIRDAAMEAGPVVVHDWWVYQVLTGAGSIIVHDESPTLLYRQHSANSIGANDGVMAKIWRIGMILSGEFRQWNDTNLAALGRSAHRLTPENRAILEGFSAARDAPAPLRIKKFGGLGLYRQTRSSTLALWISMLFGKL
ncbi:glycosyltransferase [uncultured Litoreibacter sp.]|uniref:glycosyltransferase n=1 Tax=uncultured Litoreibacter sp. TaxID=1392394 RepID=UPI00260BDB0E|nr:glycosyltransferase [uncultured Litoreibacter sp.]